MDGRGQSVSSSLTCSRSGSWKCPSEFCLCIEGLPVRLHRGWAQCIDVSTHVKDLLRGIATANSSEPWSECRRQWLSSCSSIGDGASTAAAIDLSLIHISEPTRPRLI
eukprot:3631024-Rhodomonas_salina.3